MSSEFGLPAYDAAVLTVTKETADFFEATVTRGADANKHRTGLWVNCPLT